MEAERAGKSVAEELKHVTQLMYQGYYQDAHKEVKRLESKDISNEERVDCLLQKGNIFWYMRKLKKAWKIAKQAYEESTILENQIKVLDAIILKANVLISLGKYTQSLSWISKANQILTTLELKQQEALKEKQASLFTAWASNLYFLGNLFEAWEKGQKSLDLWTELNHKVGIVSSLYPLSHVYRDLYQLDLSLECAEKGLKLSEEIGFKQGSGNSYLSIGFTYLTQGKLNLALENLEKSITIFRKLENNLDLGIVMALEGGLIHLARGEVNKASNYLKQSIDCFERQNVKDFLYAMSLNFLGLVLDRKGEFKKAIAAYKKSISLMTTLKSNHGFFQYPLSHLARLYIHLNAPEKAILYIEELKQLSERTGNPMVEQFYRLGNGFLLKASSRMRDKMRALEIFQQIAEEEVFFYSTTVYAIVSLCELLLDEFRASEDKNVLDELKSWTDKLLDLAKTQVSYALLTQTYLIQSKLALLELNLGKSQELLDQAQLITEEKGLGKLSLLISVEQELLKDQLGKWELILSQQTSVNNLIELTQLESHFNRLIRDKQHIYFYQKEEEIREYGAKAKQLVKSWDVSESVILDEIRSKKKYELIYQNLLGDSPEREKNTFRVGIAQIGVSETGDILQEFYQEMTPGLFSLRKDKVEFIHQKVKKMVEKAFSKEIDVLIFPELTIDLNHNRLYEEIVSLAKNHKMYIIPGSYHDQKTKQNLSVVFTPDGTLWKQKKFIPANIQYGNKRVKEGINVPVSPRKVIIGNTEFGRIVIVICRDFLDMDLRVELKNFEPPVDLIINPALTPVTADFKAAHFEGRRSIYAYCFFANVAEFGESFIYTPEKERVERTIPAKEENIIYKDVDLFQLRSERKRWEKEQRKSKPFIQSTRTE
ncbi:MAG: nitrilase-related carbon-nitrogen hydrolase [Candidatus Hodarchaeota archaeon]